jgi:hypothetical protein
MPCLQPSSWVLYICQHSAWKMMWKVLKVSYKVVLITPTNSLLARILSYGPIYHQIHWAWSLVSSLELRWETKILVFICILYETQIRPQSSPICKFSFLMCRSLQSKVHGSRLHDEWHKLWTLTSIHTVLKMAVQFKNVQYNCNSTTYMRNYVCVWEGAWVLYIHVFIF